MPSEQFPARFLGRRMMSFSRRNCFCFKLARLLDVCCAHAFLGLKRFRMTGNCVRCGVWCASGEEVKAVEVYPQEVVHVGHVVGLHRRPGQRGPSYRTAPASASVSGTNRAWCRLMSALTISRASARIVLVRMSAGRSWRKKIPTTVKGRHADVMQIIHLGQAKNLSFSKSAKKSGSH